MTEAPFAVGIEPRKVARVRWAVQPVKAPAGWGAVVITQAFPVPPERLPDYRLLMDTLLKLAPEAQSTGEEAFLQMDRIHFKEQASLFRTLGSKTGDFGLGYYPDQPAPTTWSRAEFLKAMPPAKLRPLFHEVMKVETIIQDAVLTLSHHFLGGGAWVHLFCKDRDVFYKRATEQFKPLATANHAFQMFPYFAPLLTRHAIETVDTATLDAWSCEAQLYLRESSEDNGLLILRRGDCKPIFRQMIEESLLPDTEFLTGWTKEELFYA